MLISLVVIVCVVVCPVLGGEHAIEAERERDSNIRATLRSRLGEIKSTLLGRSVLDHKAKVLQLAGDVSASTISWGWDRANDVFDDGGDKDDACCDMKDGGINDDNSCTSHKRPNTQRCSDDGGDYDDTCCQRYHGHYERQDSAQCFSARVGKWEYCCDMHHVPHAQFSDFKECTDSDDLGESYY